MDGEWDGYKRKSPDRHDSELITSLKLALSLMINRIKLLRLGAGK